jgi:hypothetical protein
MAVDESTCIDMMSIDRNSGNVVLTISDHLDWIDSPKHQEILQTKFNTYLAFVENGQLLEQFPEAENRPVVFRVVFKYKPDKEGRQFLERARTVIESAGFRLRHELFAESYDN